MTSYIHPSSIVAPGAKIGANVSVGPFCTVGEHVVLADGVKLVSHVAVDGHTEIGEDTEIFPFASIGLRPQDKKFKGEASKLLIGKRNIIREYVTMNPGTEGGGLITQVGDDCLFMASSHIAHDCIVGNNVILANNATVAGHVTVGDGVILGGLSAIHQFVRIGDNAFVGGMCGLGKDLIPYGMVNKTNTLTGLNLVGLRRRNVDREHINELRHLYKDLFFGEGTLAERATNVAPTIQHAEAKNVLNFLLGDTSRSFCTPDASDEREAA